MQALTLIDAYHIAKAETLKVSQEYHRALYQAKLDLKRQQIARKGAKSNIINQEV